MKIYLVLFLQSREAQEFSAADACSLHVCEQPSLCVSAQELGVLSSVAFESWLVQPQTWKRIGCSLQQKGGMSLYSGVGVSPPLKKKIAVGFILSVHYNVKVPQLCHTDQSSPTPSQQKHVHTHIVCDCDYTSHGAKLSYELLRHKTMHNVSHSPGSCKHTDHQAVYICT